ncbi:MAG: hypothetical protein HZC24_06410 [Rhodocyclales bacterium]|nr:hypothetical protein [Rhodocyclales bacterium]
MSDARHHQATTCRGCLHFHVTYDPAFPYGCRSMGFKSRRYPYFEVRALTGAACLARQERPQGAGAAPNDRLPPKS